MTHAASPHPSVVLTGASSGIGRASALQLDRAGWRVFAGVRRHEDAESLVREGSDRIAPLLIDVTDAASLEVARKTVETAVGANGLDGLVNNAGIACPGAIEFIELDELRRQLEVNLVGQVAVTQTFLPLLRQAGGRVLFVSAMGGFISNPFLGAYSASKHGLEAVCDSLRRELRPWNIRVSLLQPGTIATPIWVKGDRYAHDLIARLDERAKRLYGDSIVTMMRASDRRVKAAISPEAVARTVQRALTARRPRTRYRVGTDARAVGALSWLLPDRWMDSFLLRVAGLPRRRR
jgi:NAD(P)-dependent dehydrogenase (short-subunit alcohol dehydrogenase family)